MANRGGYLFTGLASGFLQGMQAARQKALDQMHYEQEQRRMALQEQLAQSLMKEREAQQTRLAEKDTAANYEKPLDLMMARYPELAADLSGVSGRGMEYARAADATPPGVGVLLDPPPAGKDWYLSQRDEALRSAGQKAETIRREGYEQDLSEIMARAMGAADRKTQAWKDQFKRNLASAVATGRVNLPNGVGFDVVADNFLSDTPDPALFTSTPMNNRERETLAAINSVEGLLIDMAVTKDPRMLQKLGIEMPEGAGGEGVDTGPVMGRLYELRSKMGFPHEGAASLSPTVVRNRFGEVKVQSGAQYGMKEYEQISRMAPDMLLQDDEFWARWIKAWEYHQRHKAFLLSTLRTGRRSLPGGEFSVPGQPPQAVQPQGSVLPEGFIPE